MKPHRQLAIILVLIAIAAMPALAEKVTVDPNAGSVKPAESAQTDVDKLLGQPIAYEGGYKRLHYVIEDLAARTGLRIRCGANNQDWQVRDIPVAVSVQSMPLGKLLEMLASATNLELIAESIQSESGKTEKQYRLSLSSRSRNALNNYLDAKHQASVERESQMWDAIAAHADIPDPDYSAPAGPAGMFGPSSRILSKILKDLGPDAKAKVLSGQKIELNTKDYARADLLRELNRTQTEMFAGMMQKSGMEATPQENAPCTLTISPNDDPATGEFRINTIMPVTLGRVSVGPPLPLDAAAMQLWGNTKGHDKPAVLSAPPAGPKLPDHLSKDLTPLDIKKDDEPAPSILRQKVALDLPKDKDVTYAQALAALSKATGLNITVEDFLDHKRRDDLTIVKSPSGGVTVRTTRSSVSVNSKGEVTSTKSSDPSWGADQQNDKPFSPVSELGKEPTVGDVLRAVTKVSYGLPNFEWFYNDKERLLVARPPDWIKKHTNLMPESLLVELKKKADSTGLDLDDLCKLLPFNQSQILEWVGQSKDFGFMFQPMASPPSNVFWKVYEKLTPEDKATAKSDAGLPLAKFDTSWVADFIKSGINSDQTVRVFTGTPDVMKNQSDLLAKRTALLTDPDVMRALTLRIVKEHTWRIHGFGSGFVVTSGSKPPEVTEDGWTYKPHLQGEYKGEKINETLDPLYIAFPIYSPKREAELAAKQEKKP